MKTVKAIFNQHHVNHATSSQKLADKLARYVGSWWFLLFLTIFLASWILLNIFWIIFKQWDPYPFVFLNLVLACFTTYTGPIILMAQNRAEQRDRQKFDRDFALNRKSELEVEKIQTDLVEIKSLIRKHHKAVHKEKLTVNKMEDINKT